MRLGSRSGEQTPHRECKPNIPAYNHLGVRMRRFCHRLALLGLVLLAAVLGAQLPAGEYVAGITVEQGARVSNESTSVTLIP